MQLQFTIENLEYLLFIAARVSAFVFTAPFFNFTRNMIPQRIKAGFVVFLSVILYYALPYNEVTYVGVWGFAAEVLKEVFAGAFIGFMTNAVMNILSFAGRLIDIEIGYSMVTQMDPLFMVQTSISGNLYTYLIMMMMLVSGFHRWIIQGFVDSFAVIPIGRVNVAADISKVMLTFLADYILISVEISMPIYAMILIVNIVLGIMAKVAPQMNMFVVGMQLKVLAGLAVLTLVMQLLPGVSDYIIKEMVKIMRLAVEAIR